MAEPGSQQPQSWAAWIFDAYTNNVVLSSEHDEYSDDSAYESMSSPISDTDSGSSPYGPYVRTGRGGAGNFQWQSQQSSDPEAQKPLGLKEKRKNAMTIEAIDTSAAMNNAQARKTSQYVRVGRGGAGSFIQSNQIQNSPLSTTFARSPLSASSPVTHTGRGGAGNFGSARSATDQARIAKEQQEQAEAEKRREAAEAEVESLLQAPTQVYTGTRRRSTLPDEF